MLPGHPQICLFRPEIPQNTGNIGRLAAATQCRLHLVRPFGFSEDDKQLRRPGLDYWPFLDMEIHDDVHALLKGFPQEKVGFLSKKADIPYTSLADDTQLLVFGQETQGLPDSLRQEYGHRFFRIPMYHQGVRSLNLANAVSIVLYHLLSRRGDACWENETDGTIRPQP